MLASVRKVSLIDQSALPLWPKKPKAPMMNRVKVVVLFQNVLL